MSSTAVLPGSLGVVAPILVLAFAVGRAIGLARRRAALGRLVEATPPNGRAGRRQVEVLVAFAPAPPVWVVRRLRQAGLSGPTAESVWRVGLLGTVLALWLAAVAGGPQTAGLVALAVVLGLGLAAVAVGDRATGLVDRELPAVLATVAAGMRSGTSLTVAVIEGAGRARGPAAEELRQVADALSAGKGLGETIDQWVQARPTPGVRMAGAALALAAETGGAGARTIDGVAATLRDRLAVDRELAALSSQARSSAVVIGVAPIGFVVLTAVSDPGVWDFFLRSPAGLACLAAGGLLDAMGAGWMTLVARSAR